MNPIIQSLQELSSTIAAFTNKVIDYVNKNTNVIAVTEKIVLNAKDDVTYNINSLLITKDLNPEHFDVLSSKVFIKVKIDDNDSVIDGKYTDISNYNTFEIEEVDDWSYKVKRNIFYGLDEATSILSIYNSTDGNVDLHVRIEIPRKLS